LKMIFLRRAQPSRRQERERPKTRRRSKQSYAKPPWGRVRTLLEQSIHSDPNQHRAAEKDTG
jgi:hypothetical protein